MQYANNLKDFREDHERTQEQIATLLGIHKVTYSLYETGKRQMPIECYKILSIIFDVSIDYLCGARAQPSTLSRMPYNESYFFKKFSKIAVNRYIYTKYKICIWAFCQYFWILLTFSFWSTMSTNLADKSC